MGENDKFTESGSFSEQLSTSLLLVKSLKSSNDSVVVPISFGLPNRSWSNAVNFMTYSYKIKK